MIREEEEGEPMTTSASKLKDLTIQDVDKCIRKALKMQNPKIKYEMLKECLKLMKLLLGIDTLEVIF